MFIPTTLTEPCVSRCWGAVSILILHSSITCDMTCSLFTLETINLEREGGRGEREGGRGEGGMEGEGRGREGGREGGG